MNEWIPTSERMPENQVPVLVVGKRHDRYRVVMIAYYVRRWTVSADNYNDDANDADYDPETDKEYTPEGWYENTESYEFHIRFEGTVTHWMPLPALPEV